MIELTAGHFDELCACEPVRRQLETLEARRAAAMRSFWMFLVAAIVLAVAAFVSLQIAGWDMAAWIVAFILFSLVLGVALAPAGILHAELKQPVLERLAASAGLEYIASDFTPPAYGSARALLFGGGLSGQTFTDLFHGADEEGRGYAVYEACLQRRTGKNTVTIFSGQIYAVHRRPGASAITAIKPDRKLFNFFKPASDMERVKIEGDEAFERRFEVYSTAPFEAKQLLFDSDLRRRLLDLRQSAGVLVYIGPEEALVAVAGKDRFEPGSMFRSKPGPERVRLMFDDVCASLAVLGDLKAKLG